MGVRIDGNMFGRRNVIYKELSDNELKGEDQFDRNNTGVILARISHK
jgi:hypothetical protein